MTDPNKRPKRVCSPRYALIKAAKGKQLNKWELEELAKSPEHAIGYCHITGKDFPECEDSLWEDGNEHFLYKYYFGCAKKPSQELEQFILEGEQWISWIADYADTCLNSRWEEGEKKLLESSSGLRFLIEYQRRVVKGRWKEIEDRLCKLGKNSHWQDLEAVTKYFENCGSKDEDLEKVLLEKGKSRHLYWYARKCMKGRLPPELHSKMIMLSFSGKAGFAKKYLKEIVLREASAINYLKTVPFDERQTLLEKALS